jgi:PLP dependent protein
MNDLVIKRLKQIKATIPSHVNLIAVSKKVPVETIAFFYEQGIRDFAENKLQSALDKQTQLAHLDDICWHFIGHLQTNKAKKVVESFQWIHSVDSLKLAEKLDFYAKNAIVEGKINQSPQVCLQVKILPDDHKYGWSIPDLWQDLPILSQLQTLKIRGLMAILPLGLSENETLSAFQKVTQIAKEIKQQQFFSSDFDQLSMGMSDDYALAIEAGATMIRLGSILFTER